MFCRSHLRTVYWGEKIAKSLAYRLLGNPVYCTRRLFGGVTNKTHKCVLWCSNRSLYGQFLCYAGCIVDIYWSWVFWGPVEHFWRPFAAFGALLATFWRPFGPILVAKFHLPGDVGPVWGVFGSYLGLCRDSVINGTLAILRFFRLNKRYAKTP